MRARKVRARKVRARKVRAKEGKSQPREIGACELAAIFALGIHSHDSQIAAPCTLADQMTAAVLISDAPCFLTDQNHCGSSFLSPAPIVAPPRQFFSQATFIHLHILVVVITGP